MKNALILLVLATCSELLMARHDTRMEIWKTLFCNKEMNVLQVWAHAWLCHFYFYFESMVRAWKIWVTYCFCGLFTAK